MYNNDTSSDPTDKLYEDKQIKIALDLIANFDADELDLEVDPSNDGIAPLKGSLKNFIAFKKSVLIFLYFLYRLLKSENFKKK